MTTTPARGVERPRFPRRAVTRPLATPPVGVVVLGFAPLPQAFEEAPMPPAPRFHDLPGEQYVATLVAAVAAEHRLEDPYFRPELPPMLEGRFLVDLPRLLRWMEASHRDPSQMGNVAWIALLATLMDLAES